MNSQAVELIVEFILENPNRPFSEIEYYAQSIGATDAQIASVIAQVGHRIPSDILNSTRYARSQINIVSTTLRTLQEYKPLIHIGFIIFALMSLVVLSLYLFLYVGGNNKTITPTHEAAAIEK